MNRIKLMLSFHWLDMSLKKIETFCYISPGSPKAPADTNVLLHDRDRLENILILVFVKLGEFKVEVMCYKPLYLCEMLCSYGSCPLELSFIQHFNSCPKPNSDINIVGLLFSVGIPRASKPGSFMTIDKRSEFLLDLVFWNLCMAGKIRLCACRRAPCILLLENGRRNWPHS